MKMNTAVRLLQMLPTRLDQAITIAELAAKWHKREPTRSDKRNIQRYMSDLATEGLDEPALVEIVDGKPRLFYLKLSSVANWFMTEEAALNILLTRQMLGSLNRMGTEKLIDVAEKAIGASTETRQIRERIRIVNDGLGRLPARIDPQVLQVVIESVVKRKQLNFSHVSSKTPEATHRVSPQGLVAKDGTLYLLATKGLGDNPQHFPLHRMSDTQIHHLDLQFRPDFDLDRYIQDSHQLSHKLEDEPVSMELILRVAPEALYHFHERPLTGDQSIGPARKSDGWSIVTANVRFTVLLVPFLLSMGGWIEVVGPSKVRDEMSKRVRFMASHYPSEGSA